MPPPEEREQRLMLTYMLDTNICIHVMKNYPLDLREKFNSLARATLHLEHHARRIALWRREVSTPNRPT